MNLVPQDSNFNRGSWAVVENRIADCDGLPTGELRYFVAVTYPDDVALVPDRFSMEITASDGGVLLDFENEEGGGPQGAEEQRRGVAFLRSHGCGPGPDVARR